MDIKLIAAIGKNNELGKNNDLIWRFKEDMKFFRNTTLNKPILMGRKTYESLPKLLPNRRHIVLTKNKKLSFPKEVIVVNSKNEFLEKYEKIFEEVFVIGGFSIYSMFLDNAHEMYLTEIDSACNDADVFFPRFKVQDFDMELLFKYEEMGVNYKINKYVRKRGK